MRKSRVFTLSLGMTAALLCAAAFTLTPAPTTAGTICQCPTWWTWQYASSARHPATYPIGQCCAEAQAAANCGADGICTFGDCLVGYIATSPPSIVCSVESVCNVCIDIPD